MAQTILIDGAPVGYLPDDNTASLRATAAANKTYGQQLTDIQSAYNALTNAQKARAYILIDDLYIYTNTSIDGNFSLIGVSGGTNINFTLFKVSNAKAYSGVPGSIAEITSTSNTSTLKLYA